MQIQRHQIDYVLFSTVILLTAAGVITVFSASTIIALQSHVPADSYAKKQLLSAGIGLFAMVGLSWIPHRVWYRYAVPAMGIGLFLLLIVLIPHVGWSQYGGRRWIGHGSLHLQPSELSIIATVMYLSFFFTKKITLIDNFRRGVIPGLVVAGLNVLLIFLEPDMGTAITLLATTLVIIFASGARVRPIVITMAVLGPILIGAAVKASYRSARIAAWLHPFQNTSGQSYQLIQGMTAISAGGWFGRGFDMSIEKMGYLPFPQTDFIFPVFVEEWGLVGAVALLFTFGVLIWRGFRIARRSPDRFGSLLAVGITSQIIISTIINLGAVTGLLPVTGIPLPFMSYGGTDLIVSMASVGMLISISRVTLAEEPEVDLLADVVSVEDMAELRERRVPVSKPPLVGLEPRRQSDLLRRRAEEHRKAESRHRAEVHRLQPKKTKSQSFGSWRQRTSPQADRYGGATQTSGGWRARQETAATTVRSKEPSPSSARQPVPSSKSWSKKQADLQGQRMTSSSTKKTGRFFRKER
ncbi:FtsW/RodA/SpoVE family cell cycle protein [Alicyclobacillus mengziensis]|uniref:Probable peptidoglycan glycosyltransferase FtsW n=1 Tax=Alicyclobacillus mengziensis TaxID=2931921 RepID=A0A9X7W1Z2_9BACL|nr:putative peptidoglycan glycosyltransferase FtsW [Alicyclobacillus mengziensis]QSO49149.1 cell division protein FtsW [Alicyclobacillus mengziensis]